MKNEVTTKTTSNVPAPLAAFMNEFDYSEVEAKDLKIPKLLLMQAMSKLVAAGEAKAGDLVNSVTGAVYGNVREKGAVPVKVVPIHMFKVWSIAEYNGKKFEYSHTEPVTPANTDAPWEYEQDGKKMKRTKAVNFYVLLEKDFGNKLALPHVLTFRSTSMRESGLLTDHFAQCAMAQKAGELRFPMDRIFEVSGKVSTNEEDQSWYVPQVKELGKTTPEVQMQAFEWYKTIKQQKAKYDAAIDDSDLTGDKDTEKVPF